jgi:hypothetical protein
LGLGRLREGSKHCCNKDDNFNGSQWGQSHEKQPFLLILAGANRFQIGFKHTNAGFFVIEMDKNALFNDYCWSTIAKLSI